MLYDMVILYVFGHKRAASRRASLRSNPARGSAIDCTLGRSRSDGEAHLNSTRMMGHSRC